MKWGTPYTHKETGAVAVFLGRLTQVSHGEGGVSYVRVGEAGPYDISSLNSSQPESQTVEGHTTGIGNLFLIGEDGYGLFLTETALTENYDAGNGTVDIPILRPAKEGETGDGKTGIPNW